MSKPDIKPIYDIVNNIPITEENKDTIEEIKKSLENGDIGFALEKIENLKFRSNNKRKNTKVFPEELLNPELEKIYIGLVLNNPRLIAKYYFIKENCLFDDD